jgi:lyso-ornithine lipid O-acyltransferase
MWIGSPLRGAFRLLVYLLLTLLLLPIHLLALALRITPAIRWLPVIYHRIVCVILGIRVCVHGQRSTVTPTLYVCNHVSYLDIELLGGLVPGSFVAKAEVATWPFFSTLAKAQRTIFVERRSSKTSSSRDEMLRRLNTGDNLMLFPEGTSSDGTRVLPFRSALFAVAQLRRDGKPITVQPVAISYTRLDGIPLGRQ